MLWEETRDLARREHKAPVVILYTKGKQGGLIVVHESDIVAVAAELAQRPMVAPDASDEPSQSERTA